jgi:hypothetical protein
MNNLLAHNFLPHFITGIEANRCRFFYGKLSCLVDIATGNKAFYLSGITTIFFPFILKFT